MNLVCQALTNLASGGPDDNEAQAGHLVVANSMNGNSGGNQIKATYIPVAMQCHGSNVGPMGVLRAGNGNEGGGVPFLKDSAGVRRLTPTECERLQGFPDGWTCLCQPLESYDSNACTCSDGPRYKTLGNAVTVPVIEWIGTQLLESMK